MKELAWRALLMSGNNLAYVYQVGRVIQRKTEAGRKE